MQIGLILDVIIAVLLVLTITYAVRLNQRLSQLRSDKNELQALAKTFADATVKAEAGIQQLKISSDNLQGGLEQAEALRDDLAYLVERGGRTADQMAASVRAPQLDPEDDHGTIGDDRLIEEAIRAATTGAEPSGGSGRKSGARRSNSGPGRASENKGRASENKGRETNMFATKRRNSPSREPEQVPNERSGSLGGGLGGLTPEDRLLGELKRGANEPETVGDSDAARELLKALSSVK
ncbi:MAG: hypothetical protein JKY27_11935 [Magnetovibrio sp.]|nr:hypothetical protein [Magnetovibrio sp.]